MQMDNDIRWVKTHCARLDHGGCAVLVGVKDNRIVKVKGDPDGFFYMAGVPVAAFDPEGLARVLSLPEDEEPVYLVPIGKPA